MKVPMINPSTKRIEYYSKNEEVYSEVVDGHFTIFRSVVDGEVIGVSLTPPKSDLSESENDLDFQDQTLLDMLREIG